MALVGEVGNTQKSYRIRKSLRDLVHKPRIQKEQKFSITLPPLPPHDQTKHEFAYDVLYECQRGSLAVGYSSKTLLQFDPNPWCDINMKFTPMSIENYQLPDPIWEWVSKDWMIDMTEDVDEAGWQYALKFHGAVWHGNYKHFRSFVRRRRWIRLRRKFIPLPSPPKEQQIPIEPTLKRQLSQDELLNKLKLCRLDRERFAIFNSFNDQIQLLENVDEYVNLFDYENSKYKFLSQLLLKKYDSNTNFTDKEMKAIQSLKFYYDIHNILNQFHIPLLFK